MSLFRSFFAEIKEALNNHSELKVFITGVAPMALTFASGFNVETDLTNDRKYSLLCGISRECIKKGVQQLNFDGNKNLLEELIIKNYNGYYFHPNQIEELINPLAFISFPTNTK